MTDQQLQEQLLTTAVAPPSAVWEKLYAVLEEDAADTSLQTVLLHTQAAAPAHSWELIEAELEQSANDQILVDKLNTNSLTPPPFVWEKIENRLNEEADEKFAAALHNTSVEAPAAAWTAIEAQLQQPAKVIPLYKRLAPVVRLAAAAVVVAAIAWGVYQLFNQQANEPIAATVNPQLKQPSTAPQTTNDTGTQQAIIPNSEKEPTAPLIASLDKPVRFRKGAVVEMMGHEKPATIQTSDFSETNYLLVLDDNGDLIRVSKKLSTMDCVKSSITPVDAVTALQVKDCEDKIKRLQERMATSLLGTVLDPGTITTADK